MKALKSKTMWLAFGITALGVVQANYPMVQHLVPEKYQGLVFVVIGVAVGLLRVVTTQPLSEK